MSQWVRKNDFAGRYGSTGLLYCFRKSLLNVWIVKIEKCISNASVLIIHFESVLLFNKFFVHAYITSSLILNFRYIYANLHKIISIIRYLYKTLIFQKFYPARNCYSLEKASEAGDHLSQTRTRRLARELNDNIKRSARARDNLRKLQRIKIGRSIAEARIAENVGLHAV